MELLVQSTPAESREGSNPMGCPSFAFYNSPPFEIFQSSFSKAERCRHELQNLMTPMGTAFPLTGGGNVFN